MQAFQNHNILEELILKLARDRREEYNQIQHIHKNNDNQRSYHNNHTVSSNTINNKKTKWCKPQEGLYKVNCDANLTCNGVWGLSAALRNNTESSLQLLRGQPKVSTMLRQLKLTQF
ncbi:hypothetical protein L195_g030539 [Trifolium pratense]|uniref:Uncharacterized protein n=1 Tax=Trifolium pratense TaxID=57577 RepID=A0A2K3L7U7_TRIPR|nr:hypothetical protein L195_g030539 [Trifolium pratense]